MKVGLAFFRLINGKKVTKTPNYKYVLFMRKPNSKVC